MKEIDMKFPFRLPWIWRKSAIELIQQITKEMVHQTSMAATSRASAEHNEARWKDVIVSELTNLCVCEDHTCPCCKVINDLIDWHYLDKDDLEEREL